MLVTFEPLLRFYFYKMLDRSELNFLLIDHLSTCLPVTTRQKITTWWFCQKWLALELPGRLGVPKIVVRRARENSLAVKGVNIINLHPGTIRRIRSQHVDFKNHLDIYLSSIPDQHTISGLGRAAPSNSLLHQIQMFKWEHWCKTILRGVQD